MTEYILILTDLLNDYCNILHPEVRKVLVQSLIMLRKKKCIDPLPLVELLFQLVRVQDKQLRSLIYGHIVSDVVSTNKGKRNEKVNI